MKQNVLQNIIGFIFRYIWIFCIGLIILEAASTLSAANILMKQTALGVMQSASGEISGRVDGVSRLLEGLSKDERIADTSAPLFDRAMMTKPYKESYKLFMIALTDQRVDVVSTNQKAPPEKFSNLAGRDYMQRLYATGTSQITDAFPAGVDGVTMNYTIAVPIIKDGVTVGSVFGSIYFDDIKAILARNTYGEDRNFYLLGAQNTIMAGGGKMDYYGHDLMEAAGDTRYFGTTLAEIDQATLAGIPQSFWEWGPNGLCYTTSMRVNPTNWTLMYQVKFASVLMTLVPLMSLKISCYILLSVLIYLFGRRYLKRQLAAASHLLDRMTVMQRELFQSEQVDYEDLLEMTQKGLTDQLTGLSTRNVLFNRMQQFVSSGSAHGAVFFLDLDDLKRINDNFGHEAGDCALVHFAQVLKQCEQRYEGIAARYGGDEFILLLNGKTAQEIGAIAEELCTALSTTLTLKETNLQIHGSIGIALYPEHGDKAEELICQADLALYSAKHSGKNRYAYYEGAV